VLALTAEKKFAEECEEGGKKVFGKSIRPESPKKRVPGEETEACFGEWPKDHHHLISSGKPRLWSW